MNESVAPVADRIMPGKIKNTRAEAPPPPAPDSQPASRSATQSLATGTRLLLLVIVLLAFGARLTALDQAPPGLYYDEAAHGLDALRVWQGHWYLFFPTANGHEPLFTYLVAGFVQALGNTVLAVRLPAAMLGTLAVAATFTLGRRLLGPMPALLAAGLIAITFWTVALSRIGYRANTLPVLFPLWLLSFWCCRKQQTARPYLLMGLLLGLTQYTYTAARFVPILAVILALDWWRLLSKRGLIVAAGVATLVTLPLGLAILSNLDTGTERIRDAWLFGRPQPWSLLWWQVRDHLGMWGWTGDPLWIHNLPFRPPIWWPLALLFGIGVVLGWRNAAIRALTWAVAILIWPGILAVSNNPAPPDHLRVIVLATPIFLLVAAGLTLLVRGQWAIVLAVALVLLDGGRTWRDYTRWSSARETYEQFDADMTRIARKVADSPNTFFVVPISPDWHEFEPGRHWTIDYLTGWRPNYFAIGTPYTLPNLEAEAVALVRWQAGMHLSADPQRTLEGDLNLLGYTKSSEEVENTFLLQHYQRSGQPVDLYRFAPARSFGGLRIEQVNLFVRRGATGQPDQMLAEIRWASHAPHADSLSVSLRLVDADGAVVAQVDSELWNDLGEPAPKWRPQEQSRLFLEIDPASLAADPSSTYGVALIPYETTSLAPLPVEDGSGYGVGEFSLLAERAGQP
jgi:hypothetical protein